MGDVVRLPVRREQPRSRPRRSAGPSGLPTELEPLWRESVGRELRKERLAAGKRLVDVAEGAGVSPQYLSEVERGRKDPSSEILSALAGAVDLTVRELTRRATAHLGAGPGQALLSAAA